MIYKLQNEMATGIRGTIYNLTEIKKLMILKKLLNFCQLYANYFAETKNRLIQVFNKAFGFHQKC